MPETIIVQLTSNIETKYRWLALNEESNVSTPPTFSTLDEISKHCPEATAVVLLPPEEVLLLTVKLPVIKKNRLLEAIPFAIQEELSENINDYRFTILGEQDPTSGLVHLAIIEKNRINHWHQLFLDHQIETHYFIPALLAVSFQKNCIEIMEHENTCLIRSGEYTGFVTNPENLAILLETHLTEIEKPEKIILRQYGSANSMDPADKPRDDGRMPIEIQSLPEPQYFTDLAKGALNNLHYNLLWGKLLARSKNQKIHRYWQISLGCIIAIIAIAVSNKIVQYSVYSSQNSSLLKQVAKVYKQNFPNSTEITAPEQRLENKLKNLNNIAIGNPYLNLLGTSGRILKDTSLLKINTIQFGNNSLSLEVTAQNFENLNAIINQLKATGLQVSQNNARSQGNTVLTTLLIKESK